MESTTRLFQCASCHTQVMVCTQCDRGQIYCGKVCAIASRTKSMRLAGAHYQSTLVGKHNHAARQARYRKRLKQIVTHQGSPPVSPHAPIESLENQPKEPDETQEKSVLTCCFCKKTVFGWIRHDFLRRRGNKKADKIPIYPQAP